MERSDILTVHDCRDTAYLLAGMFTAAGFRTEHVERRGDALAKLRQKSYRFLLVDCDSPFAGGVELAVLAKEMQPDLDIVLTSAGLSPEARERARAAGISVILPKPMTVEAVLDLVDRWKGEEEPAAPPPVRRPPQDWLWVCPACKTHYQGWSPLKVCSECGYRE